jgi:hypothetical protein
LGRIVVRATKTAVRGGVAAIDAVPLQDTPEALWWQTARSSVVVASRIWLMALTR